MRITLDVYKCAPRDLHPRTGHDVTGPKDYYWGRSAYVRDPDGRIVELVAGN